MAVATDDLQTFLATITPKLGASIIILPSSLSEEKDKVQEKLNSCWKLRKSHDLPKPCLLTTPQIGSTQVWVVHGSFETPVSCTAGNNGWIQKVVDLVCQVLKPLHFLILGEAEGLENDLERDVAIIAHQAGLDFPTTLAVKDGISEIYNKKGAFVLLNTPNKQVLEEKMKEHLTAVPSLDVNIYYSGHAFEDGSWFLSEDCSYTGEDLCQFIESCQTNESRRFGGDLKVYLDTCYGLSFCKAIGMTKKEWQGFLDNLKILTQDKADHPELHTDARKSLKVELGQWGDLDQVIKWAKSRPKLKSEPESELKSEPESELKSEPESELKS